MIIEGNISVKAAILNHKRKVNEIYVLDSKDDKDTNFILNKAKEDNIPIKICSKEEIDSLCRGHTHGGLLADVEKREYESLDAVLEKDDAFIVLVEGVEDPFNLGYIMRSLYSAGCDALIIKKRDFHEAEATILKSSAGAYDWMNVISSSDLVEDIKKIKEKGIKAVCAMRKDAIAYTEADLKLPILLAIGGEMRGLSAQVLNEMDENIYIPYANDFRNALNASSATAVLAYEIKRQNNK